MNHKISFSNLFAPKKILGIFFGLIMTSACAKKSGGDFSQLDVGSNLSNIKCEIASSIPEALSIRVPSSSQNLTRISVTANSSECQITYTLNDNALSHTNGEVQLDPTLLGPGANIIKVIAAGALGSSTREWTIYKNTAPVCTTQIPANISSLSIPVNNAQSFTAYAVDADSDNLTFLWTLDSTDSASISTVFSANTASQINFSPTNGEVGNRKVQANINDGYDTVKCEWNVSVTGDCSISATSPSSSATRVPQSFLAQNAFSVTTSSAGCPVTWKLNGVTVTGDSTTKIFSSSQLASGLNIIEASTAYGTGQTSKTWQVTKNSLPTCSLTPDASPMQTTGVGGILNLSLAASDADSDSVSFTWQVNSATPASGTLNSVSSGNSTNAIFSPASSQIGLNSINVIMNDTYDSATCNWPVRVLSSCTISDSLPSSSTVKIPASTVATVPFAITPNDSSCGVTWTLNGTNVSSSSFFNLASNNALLTLPSNSLTATVTNGYGSSATRTWTIDKNNIPVCTLQNPATPAVSLSHPTVANFTAGGTDSDSDPLTYSWKLNGQASHSSIAVFGTTGSASQAQFTTAISDVGNNILVAEVSDGYDSATCTWTPAVSGNCSISSYLPLASTVRALYNSSAQSVFQVTTTTAGCPVQWTLNGNPVAGTNPVQVVSSANLLAGANQLSASVSNGSGTQTQQWTVIKNTLPQCTSQNPLGGVTTNISVGDTENFSTSVTDADATDTFTASWLWNGVAQSGAVLAAAGSSPNFNVDFTPNSSLVGNGNLSAVISDGYESNSCSWAARVIPVCQISSSFPSGTTVRIPSSAVITQSLGISPNDSSCTAEWTVDGQSAGTGNVLNLPSNDARLGASTDVTVTLSNGSGQTVTRSWTLVKNSVPLCNSQTPNPTPKPTVNIPGNVALSATGSDSDADPITINWKVAGQSSPGTLFVTGSTATSSNAQFSPNFSQTGDQLVTAEISDGYDVGVCSWTVYVGGDCSITSTTPSSSSFKVSAQSGTQNIFQVSTTNTGCSVVWKLNGSTLSGSDAIKVIDSGVLSNGLNIVTAQTASGTGSISTQWNVTKNIAPMCAQNPLNSSTINVGAGGSRAFIVTATDSDAGDSLSTAWQLNGQSVSASILNPTSSGSTSGSTFTGTFNPTAGQIGANIISATLSDGYDTTSCSWNSQVFNNCSFSSSFPVGATLRTPELSVTTTNFVVVPNDSSCSVDWKLNGATIATDQNDYNLLSTNGSLLDGAGANTLEAIASNGIGPDVTRSWTISKNHAPTCGSQTPANAGLNMFFNATQVFEGTAADADSDSLSFAWRFNSGSPGLFNPINTVGNTSDTTFTPSISNLGNNQSISMQLSDGWDAGACNWSINILDPDSAVLNSCTPSNSNLELKSQVSTGPVVYDSIDFGIDADGPDLEYSWTLDGAQVGSATTPNLTRNSDPGSGNVLPLNTHALVAIATDKYNNTVTCSWNVKRNAAPTIDSYSPTQAAIRLNFGSTQVFSITASDANPDDYDGSDFSPDVNITWKLDSSTVSPGNSVLNYSSGNPRMATLNPGFDSSLLGTHTITVEIDDGLESTSRTWTVYINMFSQACNDLYNSPGGVDPDLGTPENENGGGQICTIAGQAGIGSGRNPADDQTAIRVRPNYFAMDKTTGRTSNYFFSDAVSHTVFYMNNTSNDIVYFDKTLKANQLTAVLGQGAAGFTANMISKTDVFKLNNPRNLDFDHNTGYLYVVDTSNHRIVVLASNGLARTLVGRSTVSQPAYNAANGAAHLSGTAGTLHNCNNPGGAKIITLSGTRYLFFGCYDGNTGPLAVIKRTNIHSPGTGTYGITDIAVGRADTNSYPSPGWEDGDVTTAARVHQVLSIDDDGNGNIFWSEWNSYRIRMAVLGNSPPAEFFPQRSTAPQSTIRISDQTNGGIAAVGVGTALGAVVPASNAAPVFQFSGPSHVPYGGTTCIPMRVSSLTAANGTAVYHSGTATLTLAGTNSTTFFSNSTCTTSITTVSFSSANYFAEFYIKLGATATSTVITAPVTAGTGTAPGGFTVTAPSGATGVATQMGISTVPSFKYDDCTRVWVHKRDAGNRPVTGVVRLSHGTGGQFYAANDSTCTGTPIESLTISSYTDGFIYYARTYKPKNNTVLTLAGHYGTGTFGVGNIGSTNIYNPRSIAVKTNGATIEGLFLTTDDQNRVLYVPNASSGQSVGGVTQTPNNTATGANYLWMTVAGTGTAGFNGDGKLGYLGRITNSVPGLLNVENDHLLIADTNNARVRSLNLSSTLANQTLTTILGAGRSRNGWSGDLPVASSDALMDNPTDLLYLSRNNLMFISDSNNSRIRSLDLATGSFATVVGRGAGETYIQNEDRFNVFMRFARGLNTYIEDQGTPSLNDDKVFLLYADNGAATLSPPTLNRTCAVRAYNLSQNAGTIFGESVQPDKVSALAGNIDLGCAPSTNGAADYTALANPESVIGFSHGLYISSTGENCIKKVDSNGTMSTFIGTCTLTAPASSGDGEDASGSGTKAITRRPSTIVPDPLYPNNFFFIDSDDLASGNIRYANFSTTSVGTGGKISNISIPGTGGNSAATVTTIAAVSSSNSTSRISGLAVNSKFICWSQGLAGNGDNGAHGVFCIDRTITSAQTVIQVAGSSNSGTYPYRGGASLGIEYEKVAGTQALLYSPAGLAFDADGNLYIAERSANVIRMVRKWW
jgi:hypothetical protein